MTAYYNEHDPRKAAWLRELIRRDLVAPGDVDERDIRDVVPAELSGYRQCHFFAGIGVWSYALRCAGWDDTRSVWTGSCPCQSFSAAGRRAGFADERHLWPAWFHLIGQCKPDVVLGEQVESDDSKPWLDLVWTDLEALGFAFGPVVFPAAGVGAPHGRHRIYWVADRSGSRLEIDGLQQAWGELPAAQRGGPPGDLADAPASRRGRTKRPGQEGGRLQDEPGRLLPVGLVADANGPERGADRGGHANGAGPGGKAPVGTHRGGGAAGILANAGCQGRRQERQDGGGCRCGSRTEGLDERPGDSRPERGDAASGVADTEGDRLDQQRREAGSPEEAGWPIDGGQPPIGGGSPERDDRPGPVNGFWRTADWLRCRDPDPRSGALRWRPARPGSFPLAHGAPARVVRLCGYGDGLVAPAAEAFIRAYLDTIEAR